MLRVRFPNSQDLLCTSISSSAGKPGCSFLILFLLCCGWYRYCCCSTLIGLQETDQGAAHALDETIQSQSLYESPAFRVSREGLDELVAEVKRVDALITNKPPGHPVSDTAQLYTLVFKQPVAHTAVPLGLYRDHTAQFMVRFPMRSCCRLKSC